MNRSFVAVALTAVAALSAACSSPAPVPAAPPAPRPGIEVVAKSRGGSFWAAVQRGAQEGGQALGWPVRFTGPASEAQADEQQRLIVEAIERRPAALIVSAIDQNRAAQALRGAAAASIPVVAIDSGIASRAPVTTVATDNRAAAGEAARHLAGMLGRGPAAVAVISHGRHSQTATQRVEGFSAGLAEHAPRAKVVQVHYADSDAARARRLTADLLAAQPGLTGLFATDDEGAIGASQALTAAGRRDVRLIGFDSGARQVAAVNEGVIAGAITQNPRRMGYLAVEKAAAAVQGRPLRERYDSGFAWYDATNLDDPEIAAALYP